MREWILSTIDPYKASRREGTNGIPASSLRHKNHLTQAKMKQKSTFHIYKFS